MSAGDWSWYNMVNVSQAKYTMLYHGKSVHAGGMQAKDADKYPYILYVPHRT